MNQAVGSSKDAEKELGKLRGIAGRIPPEAKEQRLTSDIDRIAGKLNKQEFTTTKTRTTRTLTKLTEQVPAQDKALGKKMDSVKEDAGRVEKAAQDLRKLIGSGVTPGNYQEFANKIEALKGSWQMGDVIKKDIMAALVQSMKHLNGKDPVNQYSADPVNLSTGNFIYEKEELQISGRMPLSFHRFYNALEEQEGSLGTGWIHNYEVHLKIEDETSCVLCKEEGAQEHFIRESEQVYRSIRTGLDTIEVLGAEAAEAGTDNTRAEVRNVYISIRTGKGCGTSFTQRGIFYIRKMPMTIPSVLHTMRMEN